MQDSQDNFSELPQLNFVDICPPIMFSFEFMKQYGKLSRILKSRCKVYIISSTIIKEYIVRRSTDTKVVLFQVKPVDVEFLDSTKGKLLAMDGV